MIIDVKFASILRTLTFFTIYRLKQFLLSAGMTCEHAVSRKQFGSPLSEFGLIQVKSKHETVQITAVRVWSHLGKV